MEAVKKVNDETNILEFIENFSDINGRNPRLHELKEEFEDRVSNDLLKMVVSGLYSSENVVEEV